MQHHRWRNREENTQTKPWNLCVTRQRFFFLLFIFLFRCFYCWFYIVCSLWCFMCRLCQRTAITVYTKVVSCILSRHKMNICMCIYWAICRCCVTAKCLYDRFCFVFFWWKRQRRRYKHTIHDTFEISLSKWMCLCEKENCADWICTILTVERKQLVRGQAKKYLTSLHVQRKKKQKLWKKFLYLFTCDRKQGVYWIYEFNSCLYRLQK